MYNYFDSVKADVHEAIRNNYTLSDYENREELEERLDDDLWIDDSVTGNGSGSYTFSSRKAEEYVKDNFDLVCEMASDFDISASELGERIMNGDWEWIDVSIRCNLLGRAIGAALDDLEEDGTIPAAFSAALDDQEEDEEIPAAI